MERIRDEAEAWLRSAALLLAAAATSLVALVLLLAFGIGLVLVPVFGLGLPVVAGALGAIRRLADRHRLEAGSVRATVLGRGYVAEPGARPRELLACLRDPQTWRDALWLALHVLAGQVVIWGFGVVLVEVVPAILASGGDVLTDVVLAVPLVLIAAVLWWSVPWLVRGFAALAQALLDTSPGSAARRIAQLTASRAATVDAQAAELRRIERDLHDGAQARLAAVGMTLGLAAQVLRTDPQRAAELLEEARTDAGRALAELRDLVRGIHPPVLADRGLAGGLEAAALLCPVPVQVHVELSGRPDAPVE
jgi:signal transduction histidine kinase